MPNPAVSQEALNKALLDATAQNNESLLKATFAQTTNPTQGLQGYDLDPVAKMMYPVLTPLRNRIPRVKARGGSEAHWKAITGINTARVGGGVSQGNRGATVSVAVKDYAAVYKTLGAEADATFEGVNAAEGFADLKAQAALTGLQTTMLNEEVTILGGNRSLSLGITPTPSLAGAGTGGTLAAATWSVICVALSLEGRLNGSVAGGILGLVSRTNADGSTDTYGGGSARKSAAATVATSGATSKITATVTAVAGACGYAWFWGAAGSEVLGAITGYPGVVITAAAAGSQAASTVSAGTDYSTNDLVYDGLLTQAFNSSYGSYWKDFGGAPLTSDGAGGVPEIDAILKHYWNTLKMSPDTMWISASEAQTLNAALVAGSANGAYRINVSAEQGAMMGGLIVKSYLNKYGQGGNKVINIEIHPNMPQGMILFTADTVPYPLSGTANLMQIKTRQDYYQIDWPLKSRKYEYGVYTDGVLQHYFPPALAVMTGIGSYQEGLTV